MKHEQADLWGKWEQGHKIVITTNVGWDPVTRQNNMGAGMALQAARRWPWLPEWYGNYCRVHATRMGLNSAKSVPVVEHDHLRLLFLPVKPLLSFQDPERSWDQTARLDVISIGLRQLRHHHGTIALAFPGCGNGGLKPQDVLPLLRQTLIYDRFTVCDWDYPVEDLPPADREAAQGPYPARSGDAPIRRVGLTSMVDGLGMLDAAIQGAGLKVVDGELVRQ